MKQREPLIKGLKQKYHGTSSVLKESVLVSGTEYLMLGALFVINVLLTRYYGVGELGIFNFCYAIAQITILGIGGAFSLILRRDLTLFPERQKKYVAHVLQLRTLLLIVSVIFLIPVVYIFKPGESSLLMFLFFIFLTKGFDLFSETYYTTYQSIQQYRKFSVIKSMNAFFSMAAVLICCILRLPVISVYLSLLSVAIAFFIFNKIYYNAGHETVIEKETEKPTGIPNLNKYLLTESWPVMINALFYQFSSRIPVVIIFALLGKIDAGLFSAGLVILTVFSASANAVGIVLFPGINKYFHDYPKKFPDYIMRISARILFLGIAVYGLFLLLAPYINKIFGEIPESANSIFYIMGMSIPFIFLTGVIGNIFIIIRRQKTGMMLALLILIFNITILYLAIILLKSTGFAIAYSVGNAIQILLIGYIALFIVKKRNSHISVSSV